MRFIPPHAIHVCIFGAAVVFLMQVAAAVPPPPAGRQRGSGNSNTNLVSVIIDDRRPINLNINTNGDLAYADLDQKGRIYEVAAVSEVHAKCFLWQRQRSGSLDLDFATTVFSSREKNEVDKDEESGILFRDADRVYCYNGSRDSIDGGGTFTLLVQPGDQSIGEAAPTTEATRSDRSGPELLRLRVGRDDDFADAPLQVSANLEAQLGESRSMTVKLLDWPAVGGSNYSGPTDAESRAFRDLRESDPGCFFLAVGRRTNRGNSLLVNKYKSKDLYPIDAFHTVVCFRDQDNQRMRQNWKQARSRNQQA